MLAVCGKKGAGTAASNLSLATIRQRTGSSEASRGVFCKRSLAVSACDTAVYALGSTVGLAFIDILALLSLPKN